MRSFCGKPLFGNTGWEIAKMVKKVRKRALVKKNRFHPFHESRCNFCPWTSLKMIDSDLKSLRNPLNLCSLKVIRDIPIWIPKIPMKVKFERILTPKWRANFEGPYLNEFGSVDPLRWRVVRSPLDDTQFLWKALIRKHRVRRSKNGV